MAGNLPAPFLAIKDNMVCLDAETYLQDMQIPVPPFKASRDSAAGMLMRALKKRPGGEQLDLNTKQLRTQMDPGLKPPGGVPRKRFLIMPSESAHECHIMLRTITPQELQPRDDMRGTYQASLIPCKHPQLCSPTVLC